MDGRSFYSGERLDERVKANDLACLLSHKKALELAQSKNWKTVLVLEDDVEFPAGFDEALDNLLDNCPEFDMLFLHGTYGRFNKPVVYNEHLMRVRELYGAFAYIVHSRFYKRLIEELEKQKGLMGTDYVFCMMMKKAEVYRALKPLVFHKEGYSYRTERRETMYKHLERKK